MYRRIVVGDNERVLVTRNRRFAEILEPGEYRMLTLLRGVETETYNVRDLVCTGTWAEFLMKERPEVAARYFNVVETSDAEVAVVLVGGKVTRAIGPGERVAFWKGRAEVKAERINIREAPEVPARLIPALARLGRASLATFTVVEEGKRGLVYIDGRFVRELEAGTYGFWSALGVARVEIVEMRRQTVEVPGQEILTKDKVTLRVNISTVYEVTNAAESRARVKDAAELLYRTLQIAVRQTLGRRTLEEVLAEKADIDEAVLAGVRAEMEPFGLLVRTIAIRDIILPGDIRNILNEVVTAEKQAQANLIRRREETAATRSLLNTAKLLEENPLMVRLKELETLEKIAGKVEKITVVGGLNSLLEKTVTLHAG